MTDIAEHDKPAPARLGRGRFDSHFVRRGLRAGLSRLVSLAGELTAIGLGLAFLWCYGMNTLLARKSLDMSFIEPNLALWFADAFDGRAAEIEDMTLTWQPGEGTILFKVSGIEVKDKSQANLNTIGSLSAAFEFEAAMRGQAKIHRANISGGAVTWRKDKEGRIIAGVGTPETVGRFATIPAETLKAPSPRDNGARRLFTLGPLSGITVTQAQIYVVDEQSGLNLAFQDTDMSVEKRGGLFHLDAAANLPAKNDVGALTAKASFSPDYEDFDLRFTAKTLNPSASAPQSTALSQLRRLDARVDVDLAIQAVRGEGLTRAALEFSAGPGNALIGLSPTRINGFDLTADYDPAAQILEITQARLDAAKYGFTGTGQMTNIGRPAIGFFRRPTGFKTELSAVRLDMSQYFDAPFTFKTLDIDGGYDPGNAALVLNKVKAAFPEFTLETRLEASRNEAGAVDTLLGNGRLIGTMTPKHLMSVWPSEFAGGARRWIERSILRGSIQDLTFDFDIPKSAFAGERLSNEDVTLAFGVTGGEVRYIQTMTPLTNAAGRGVLRGNSFEFDAVSGAVGGLRVQEAHVDIPVLSPKGGDLIIEVKGEGGASEMLSLIDQKPFEFASRYGILPASFNGQGNIDLTITRPLLEYFDQNRIKYAVTGDFTDVKVPFALGPHRLKDGRFKLAADTTGVTLSGPVNMGPWAANLEWAQPFAQEPGPTLYKLSGPMNRQTFDGFGIGFREYFGGDIEVDIDAVGKGLSVTDAAFTADLTATELNIGEYWSKSKGVAAQISGDLARSAAGALSAENMKMQAPGLSLEGRVRFAQDMRLLEFALDDMKVDGVVDASLQVSPSPDQTAFNIRMRGAYLDIAPFVSRAIKAPTKSGISLPMNLDAELGRLALNPAFILRDANLKINHNGIGIKTADVRGVTSDGNFQARIQPIAGENRRAMRLDIPNASQAVVAFFKLGNIKGGRMQLDASLPEIGVPGKVQGTLQVEDFSLVNAPVFAKILSLASLKGLADAMGGSGLNFDRLDVPFAYEQGELNVREARASGPALGLTGNGDIDLGKKIVDFDGVLVPAYTANSALASIPVIGDIFVGKKGEGIFALRYSIIGPFSSTQVGVNPLSALTPGFLRQIFEKQRDALPDQKNSGEDAEKTETPQ